MGFLQSTTKVSLIVDEEGGGGEEEGGGEQVKKRNIQWQKVKVKGHVKVRFLVSTY